MVAATTAVATAGATHSFAVTASVKKVDLGLIEVGFASLEGCSVRTTS